MYERTADDAIPCRHHREVSCVSGISLSTNCVTCTVQPAPRSTAGSAAALQAEVRRVQSQLADWASCVSAKTPEGKAHIADLSRKLDAAEAQMAKAVASTASTSAVTPAHAMPSTAALTSPYATSSTPADRPGHRTLDVWA